MAGSEQEGVERLVYLDEPHEYYFDGARVPSVTQVLSGLVDYTKVDPAKLTAAATRGKHVHKMIEYWAAGVLDVKSLPDWMRPAYDNWMQFVSDSGFELVASEKRVYHNTLRYAGTLDLRGTIRRFKDVHGIIDIKRSFLAGPVIGLQLAGYAMAENLLPGPKVRWRAALRLSEKGPYRLQFFDDESDESVFIAQLVLRNFKAKHGL